MQGHVNKNMDGNQWTIVQKKSTNQRLPVGGLRGPPVDSVEAFPRPDHSKLKKCEYSVSVNQSRRRGQNKEDGTASKQADISSLIGTPFILRSSVSNEPEVDENPKTSKKIKSGPTEGSIRGILKIDLSKVNRIDGLSNGEKVKDKVELGQMNDVDWPSISGNQSHSTKEEQCTTDAGSEGDSKSWSTVLRSAPLTQPNKEMKSNGKNGDHSGSREKGEKSASKQKRKKEGGHSNTSVEKRRDQPLLLEFDSLFESLQVQGSKKVIATGGAPLLLSKPATKQDTHHKETSRGGNILDSSAPAIRRGKERETPKKKRPSALRKVISTEREMKKAGIPLTDIVTSPVSNGHVDSSAVSKSKVRPSIHNRRFRDYCDHLVNEEINSCVECLLTDLVRFQDRMYLKDPIKAKAKRRYVCGMREVLKHLKIKKLKCLILPPNLDSIQSKGGINDVIHQILAIGHEQQLPIIYATSRRRLAFVLKKRHKVGCVGIFSYDGAEVHYKLLMTLVETARAEYDAKVSAMNGDDQSHGELVQVTMDSPKCIQVESDLPSGSSESSDSEVENDVTGQDHIMSTPWKIFFEPSSTDHIQFVKPSESAPLNANATEFVPSFTKFKFNVDAEEFVP